MATGLEKVSFHSNPKERKCQRMFKLPHTSVECSSHTLVKKCSKFSKPGFNKMWTMNFQIFRLVLEKAEEPDQIANICWIIEKSKTVPEKHLFLVYWLCQILWLCGTINWKILKDMGIPDHLRSLYANQDATVRTGQGTDWFQIGKGERQGFILLPCLFNLYAEYIMRNAGLDEAQATIKVSGRNISNLRYADETTLMAERKEELKSFL